MNVVFHQGVDVDQAQVLVQNRMAVAEARLPEEVRRLGITEASAPEWLAFDPVLCVGGSWIVGPTHAETEARAHAANGLRP